MDVVTSLHQDSIHGFIDPIDTETPGQEPQRICTRNLPCLQQGCMICSTPTYHVRNLGVALNSNYAPTSPINPARPPPIDHPILLLTTIQQNDIDELTNINHLYKHTMKSNIDCLLYDRSNLCATRQTAMNLLNSHITTFTPLPTSPPNSQVHAHSKSTTICQFQAS